LGGIDEIYRWRLDSDGIGYGHYPIHTFQAGHAMGAMGRSCHRAGRLIAGVLRDALGYPENTSHSTVEDRSINNNHIGYWVHIVFGTREEGRSYRLELKRLSRWHTVEGIKTARPSAREGNYYRQSGLSMNLIMKSIIGFFRGNGPIHAGSVAYFSLMSFVPLCFVLIAIFGYLLGDNIEFYEFFSARAMRFFPSAASKISEGLTALVTYRKIGIFSLVVYTYFSYLLYRSMESAVHVIFREKGKRSPLISVVMSFLIISIVAGLMIVSFVANSLIQMLNMMFTDLTGLRIGFVASFLIRFVIPVLLVFLTTSILYTLIPVKKIALRHAFCGGAFTASLLEVARHLFNFYIINVATQIGAIYGPLSSVVIFLLWIYYAACIFLVGAEIVRILNVPS
jgi:YihY family inner membrane protein